MLLRPRQQISEGKNLTAEEISFNERSRWIGAMIRDQVEAHEAQRHIVSPANEQELLEFRSALLFPDLTTSQQ